MLKPKEVCQKLGMSYRTLQSYVKEGYIKPVVQSGSEVQEDLEKLMGIVKRGKWYYTLGYQTSERTTW